MFEHAPESGLAGGIVPFLFILLVLYVVMIGYIIVYLYKVVTYKNIFCICVIIVVGVLGIYCDSVLIRNYTEGAVWEVGIRYISSIFVWTSYSVILSLFLFWFSKRGLFERMILEEQEDY